MKFDDAAPSRKDEPFDVPLLFSEETGAATHGFKMVGNDSDRCQTAESEWQLIQLQKSARRGRGIDAKARTGAEELQKVLRSYERYIVEACTISVYGWKVNGTEVEVSPEVLDAIFADHPTWIAKLLGEVRADRPFLTPSSGS